ncbi:MAG: redoxin domain-containing protein [Clostridia bacterium]|nr:redoxin domain-containing protein [Clostridia bacterium]
MAFATYNPYFVQRNVQLIGLSIDSVYSHLAWVYNIYRNTGIEIPFPVIADLDMKVATLYGMISPAVSNTSTIRNVFIIDDKQVIRAILQYPQSTGRYIPEIIRIIDSLQTVDREKAVTPANWLPGSPVIVPPPQTYEQLKERVQNPQGYQCVDWYLCFKPGGCGQIKSK